MQLSAIVGKGLSLVRTHVETRGVDKDHILILASHPHDRSEGIGPAPGADGCFRFPGGGGRGQCHLRQRRFLHDHPHQSPPNLLLFYQKHTKKSTKKGDII